MNLLLTEKLSRVNQASSDDEQIQLLNAIKSPAVAGLLKINFNPDINFNLPEGTPPFKVFDKPKGIDHSYLEVEYRNFGYFFGESNLTPMKRENLFIDILERLYVDEANLLLAIKNHQLTKLFPNIKKRNVLKAYWNMDVVDIEEESIEIVKEEESPEYVVVRQEESIQDNSDADENSILDEFIVWQDISKEIYIAQSNAAKYIGGDVNKFKQKLENGEYGFVKYPEGIRVYDIINYLASRK